MSQNTSSSPTPLHPTNVVDAAASFGVPIHHTTVTPTPSLSSPPPQRTPKVSALHETTETEEKKETEENSDGGSSLSFEQRHVHETYEQIAPHFSASRYKEWPEVANFLQSLPPYAIIADAGCGNGKYFECAQYRLTTTEPQPSQRDSCSTTTTTKEAGGESASGCSGQREKRRKLKRVRTPNGGWQYEKAWIANVQPTRRFVLGFDRCRPLLELALEDVSQALPSRFRPGAGMTGAHEEEEEIGEVGPSRRRRAKVSPGGQCDAQKEGTDRTDPAAGPMAGSSSSLTDGQGRMRRGRQPPRGADALCCDMIASPFRPGVFDAAVCIAVIHHYATSSRRKDAVRELLRLIRPEGGRALIYVWALEKRRKPTHEVDESTGDAMIPWQMNEKFDDKKQVFQRYYHLFRKGELEQLCLDAMVEEGVKGVVERSYYDHENWCVIIRRGE